MFLKLAITVTLALTVLGHGIHDEPEDVALFRRNNLDEIAAIHKRCASTLDAIQRRRLARRGFLGPEARSEHLSRASVCTLAPELTEGPYYVNNEIYRANVTDGQGGVPLKLEVTVIDLATCAIAPNRYVEIWAANSTGFYSGFTTASGGGPGGGGGASDNLTFQRGVAKADATGLAILNANVPGWYTGRSIHIHVRVWENSTVSSNGLFNSKSGYLHHTGQIFFQQTILDQIATLAPYTSNKLAYASSTKNAQDGIYAGASAGGYDPHVETTLIGSTLSAGILGEIVIAVNGSFVGTSASTVTHTARDVKVTDGAV